MLMIDWQIQTDFPGVPNVLDSQSLARLFPSFSILSSKWTGQTWYTGAWIYAMSPHKQFAGPPSHRWCGPHMSSHLRFLCMTIITCPISAQSQTQLNSYSLMSPSVGGWRQSAVSLSQRPRQCQENIQLAWQQETDKDWKRETNTPKQTDEKTPTEMLLILGKEIKDSPSFQSSCALTFKTCNVLSRRLGGL